MKKITSMVLMLLVILTLSACKGPETTAQPETAQEQTAQVQQEAKPTKAPAPKMITIAINTDLVKEAKMLVPDVTLDVIGTLSVGDNIELINAGTEWHEVVANGTQGFVKASDVAGVDPAKSPYYIFIEKGSHTINVYKMDESGAYTVLVKSFLTATGLTAGKTPTGVFEVFKKYEWKRFDSAGTERAFSYSPYVTQFTDGIYIHGSVYAEKDFEAMYGNMYKEIGSNATAGCMRTNAGAAYWIYINCPMGTVVEVVNGSPRSMLTPELLDPIHDLAKGRYYDPTDPNLEDPVILD